MKTKSIGERGKMRNKEKDKKVKRFKRVFQEVGK
jgi:hypothetical protein